MHGGKDVVLRGVVFIFGPERTRIIAIHRFQHCSASVLSLSFKCLVVLRCDMKMVLRSHMQEHVR